MKNKLTNTKTIRSIFTVCGLLLLSFLTQLNAAPASAVEEEPTLTINTISDTTHLDLTPTGTDGTFATSADSGIVFNVSTNNFSGYSLLVTTNDNSPSLVSGSSTIGSIGSSLTAIEFNTAANDNKWGFKPSKYYDSTTSTVIDNSGEDGVFLPAPASTAQLDKTTAANSTDNSYTITVGMRVNLETKAGDYTGALNIISVANPAAYIINFEKNASETIANFPENLDGMTFDPSIQLPSDAPTREHYTFIGWCNVMPTNNNGTDTCTGENAATYQPGESYTISHLAANNATLRAMWQIDRFTQSVKYRFENADGTFTDWVDAEDETVNYGDTFTWNPADKITDFDGDPYQDITPISYTVEDDQANEITFMRKTFTITKRYKLEDADGNYPDEFTADGTATVRYGESYAYRKAVVFYDTQEIEEPSVTDNIYLDVLLPRSTYPIYIQKGNADIETISSDGRYRWGQIITVTGTSYADNNCSDYGEVTWSRSGFGNFVDDNTTGSTVQYQVGTGTATLRAWGTHEDIPQTITFSAPNGETITFDGVDYHDGDTTQAICATFDISATIKEQPVEDRIYLQDITPATCPTTKTRVYDRRDNESYYIQKLADGNCWLLDNLRLDSATTTTLTTTNTNMSPLNNFELPDSWPLNSGYSYETLVEPRITTNSKNDGLDLWWHANKGTFGDGYHLGTTYTVADSTTIAFAEVSRIGVYYNYCAATAGTWCVDREYNHPEGFVSDGKVYDICPAGWRLPTGGAHTGEYSELAALYDTVDDFMDALNVRLGSGMVNAVNTPWNQRSIGYYWSGTPYMHIYGYYLATWQSGRINDGFNDRYIGQAVRCMMQIPTEP